MSIRGDKGRFNYLYHSIRLRKAPRIPGMPPPRLAAAWCEESRVGCYASNIDKHRPTPPRLLKDHTFRMTRHARKKFGLPKPPEKRPYDPYVGPEAYP